MQKQFSPETSRRAFGRCFSAFMVPRCRGSCGFLFSFQRGPMMLALSIILRLQSCAHLRPSSPNFSRVCRSTRNVQAFTQLDRSLSKMFTSCFRREMSCDESSKKKRKLVTANSQLCLHRAKKAISYQTRIWLHLCCQICMNVCGCVCVCSGASLIYLKIYDQEIACR